MKKKIVCFAAFALVLTFCVAAVFLPASFAFASGNFDPVAPPYDDLPEPEDFAYHDVYYFTNRRDALTARNDLAAGLSSRYPGSFDFHYKYYGADNGFGMDFDLLPCVNANSIIVFEIRGISSMLPNDSNEKADFLSYLNDSLEYMFRGWQADGCRIIFLNDTEEARMLDLNLNFSTSPYTKFLEYADVHINTDFFTLFIDTILYNHFGDFNPIGNFTFLMDTSFGTSVEEFVGNWLFNEYLSKYMLMTDSGYYTYRDNPVAYFGINGISFMFYDAAYVSQGGLADLSGMLFDSNADNLLVLGTNLAGNAGAELWLEDMCELRSMLNCRFEIYEYFYFDATDLILSYGEAVKTAWNVDALYLDSFWSIFDTLARDGDLSGFDNLTGRCAVTYKPVGGGDGWLRRRTSLYLLLDEEWIEFYA